VLVSIVLTAVLIPLMRWETVKTFSRKLYRFEAAGGDENCVGLRHKARRRHILQWANSPETP